MSREAPIAPGDNRTGEVLLTTPRLSLRSWRPNDLPTFAALNADPEVMRYLGTVLTGEQADELANAIQERFAQRGFGMLPVERRTDGAFLGICGVNYTPWYPDEEIGWRFAREHWGRGTPRSRQLPGWSGRSPSSGSHGSSRSPTSRICEASP